MTRSNVKRLTEPIDEPEREFRRLKRVALRSHQNESLAIAGRNLFDNEASPSNNTRPKSSAPPKTLHEHSHPTSSGFQNPITIPTEQTGRIVDSHDIWFIQNTCTFQGLKNEDPLHHVKHYLSIIDNIQADGATRDTSRKLDQFTQFRFHSLIKKEGWIQIDEYVQYQDDLWDDMPPPMNISSILKTVQPIFRGHLKRVCNQISYLETPAREVEQVCLFRGDIYDDPSLLRFYQNDDTSPWGNNKRKGKGEDGPEWTIKSKFEDELANFMLEKKSHAKRIGDMLVQYHKELHEQYSQILSAINKSKTPKPEAPTFTITTISGISTQDPPFSSPTTTSN
ncbi:hypothetical protein Tco_0901203 [Tanacetum coccineum]